MDKLIVKEVLGVDLKVLTSNGEHHTLSFMDFIGNVAGSSMSIDTDDGRVQKCMIDIHLECNKFSYGVDV